jgi:hypothetical protein
MTCTCEPSQLRRGRRQGFPERYIYWLAGLFPWVCQGCNRRVMRRKRHDALGAFR